MSQTAGWGIIETGRGAPSGGALTYRSTPKFVRKADLPSAWVCFPWLELTNGDLSVTLLPWSGGNGRGSRRPAARSLGRCRWAQGGSTVAADMPGLP